MICEFTPYSTYKNSGVSWIGNIPEHWRCLSGRSCYRPKNDPNVGLQETTVLSLSYGQIVVKPADKLHGLVPASFETYQIVEPNDIIVRPTDLQNDWNSLRFGLSHHRGIITSAYLCFQPQETLMLVYGHLLLHAYDLKKVFYGLGSGLRQNLDWTDFKYLPCLVPPPIDQAAIAAFLDHVDKRIRRYIRAKQRLIVLLNEVRQAIVHRVLLGGFDPNGHLKSSGMEWLVDVPENWRIARLKDAAVVQTGLTLGKNYQGRLTESRPYLRVANVQHGRLDLRVVKCIDVLSGDAARATLRAGDVLMTEGGDIDKLGRGCVWHDEIPNCLHQNHVFAVRCRQGILMPEFLVTLMSSGHGRAYFQLTAKQTTNLASTNSSTLRAFPILIPPVAEQEAILARIGRHTAGLEAATNRTEREIDLIREYHTRLICDVVMGKLDVRHIELPQGEAEPVNDRDDQEQAEDIDDTLSIEEATVAE